MPSDYAKSLGARLRSIRQQQGLSLQGVEEKSAGRWKAVVVGSYERGDRAVTVSRLAELADFYRVPSPNSCPRAAPPGRDSAGKIVLDLEKLYDHANDDLSTSPSTRGRSSRPAATTTAGCSRSAPTTCARWRSSTTTPRPA